MTTVQNGNTFEMTAEMEAADLVIQNQVFEEKYAAVLTLVGDSANADEGLRKWMNEEIDWMEMSAEDIAIWAAQDSEAPPALYSNDELYEAVDALCSGPTSYNESFLGDDGITLRAWLASGEYYGTTPEELAVEWDRMVAEAEVNAEVHAHQAAQIKALQAKVDDYAQTMAEQALHIQVLVSNMFAQKQRADALQAKLSAAHDMLLPHMEMLTPSGRVDHSQPPIKRRSNADTTTIHRR